ncbi:methyl-coenzyme M reductase subunit D [Methanosarcina thermophila]|jgi:methyl-coenzyme M reductase subunit D|uniref:Methyl coenzyme M reductase, subunit C n=3 Tax=Methanosarcina thermophila TaxID=2210 RepID=A0A1I6X3X3_METTE|nr:methyl-coenzyme M reductase operon protein D [Methanosarcina thermophila]AKB13399.1 Methyl coenzyme M reductase operon protein D [Methanosarcina thermophila TM-1]AKB15966.1 Methyl coenzyme M reductase operon protein D [Methanosarcina thermophila CHTI-55]NLU57461.1 methyl-coenzyme M reductase operon protein D [Methanosarcina thermophila]SFT32872.1 methyl-coenzyme M reductase subunit D [Methanosarcina thermophila]BAW28398.1 methyl coenzyme M reductase, subunit C [Methanosarcina thermophila]
MSDSASNTEDFIQIEIFPSRILSPETAQKLISEIYKVDGVIRVMVQGNRLPDRVCAGPGTGERVEHPLRKPIQIGDQVVELKICVGRIRVELSNAEAKEQIREICEKLFPFPFEFREGHFLRRKPTVTDYAKLGPGADPRFLGMVDPKSRADQLIFIEKQEKQEKKRDQNE